MKKIYKVSIMLILIINFILLFSVDVNADISDGLGNDAGFIYINEVGISNFDNVNYIENYKYFMANPEHADSNTTDNGAGTCTTVAMQLLLGYHNYYSDRRIIPEFDENNNRFLSSNYASITSNPIIASYSDSTSLGTNNLLYEKLMEYNWFSGIWGVGQYEGLVAESAKKFIKNYAPEISSNISIQSFNSYNKNTAVNMIERNVPIILGCDMILGEASNYHVVVAYGFANYNNEFGYIVHCGWGSDSVYVWIPETFFQYMITMEVSHNHNFISNNNLVFNSYVELECTICGANTADRLYEIDEYNGEIVDLRYDVDVSLYLPSILYGVNIVGIAEYAFINCTTLERLYFSDTIEYIGDFSFKNCSSLEYIDFPNSLISIGDSAFENCSSLTTINIPSSVTSIGDLAFKNCTSLTDVTINRDNYNITELGTSAFYGCSSLNNIHVPSNRIFDYSNASNWKTYKSKITSDVSFEEIDIHCYSNINSTITINPGEKGILKINVNCPKNYKITASSNNYIIFKLYDSYMNEIDISPTSYNSCSGEINSYLTEGEYYISVEYTHPAVEGEALINIQLSNTNNNSFEYGSNNVLTHLHNVNGELQNSSVYTNYYGRGLYKITINGNLQSYQNVLTIYDNSNKDEPMKRIETSLYELDARTSMVNNNLVVYFNEGYNYYIDIIVPIATYNTLTLSIERIEEPIEVDLVHYEHENDDDPTNDDIIYEHIIMTNETRIGDHFVLLEILEPSSISVIYDYTGTQDEFIYFVLFKEVYNNNESQYEMQLVFPEMMVTYGESLEWKSSITAGRHYIGYFNKLNPNSTISITITR